MDVKVYTQFDPPPYDGATMGGESLVETAGYIPAEVQINSMLQAGERLQAGRREAYDFGADDDIPEDYIDPTRSPNYDLADASVDARNVASRIREQQTKIAEESKKIEKSVEEEKE